MFKIEHEYETPIDSNYYQYEIISSILHKPDNNQKTTNYTPYVIETNSFMKKIYQKTTNQILPPNEEIGQYHFILESPKKRAIIRS